MPSVNLPAARTDDEPRKNLPRPYRKDSHEPANLYLTSGRKRLAAEVAVKRYNLSLSELVDRLLERELGLDKGLLLARVWHPRK